MRLLTAAGLSIALLIAACTGQLASTGTPPPGAATVAPAPAAPPPASPATPPAKSSSAPAVDAPNGAAAREPATAPSKAAAAVPPATASQGAVKPASPPAKAPAVVAKAPAASPKKENPLPEVARKAAPTLDLTSLEQRLKETDAIGVLTKLALKNQVDDLLGQFRAFYQGKVKTTLAELRRPYDLLVMKVLALLQDSDPALASAIVASREAIWGILSDPVKFATI
jgi:hypothetical protein